MISCVCLRSILALTMSCRHMHVWVFADVNVHNYTIMLIGICLSMCRHVHTRVWPWRARPKLVIFLLISLFIISFQDLSLSLFHTHLQTHTMQRVHVCEWLTSNGQWQVERWWIAWLVVWQGSPHRWAVRCGHLALICTHTHTLCIDR